MIYSIIDQESDGLVKQATRIHCLCYVTYNTDTGESKRGTITDYDEMRAFYEESEILVCHNLVMFDKPLAEKILNIKIKARLIDTLGLSWYLYPNMEEVGLEMWGNILGVKKPVIDDWTQQNIENIIIRCQEDVKINDLLFDKQVRYLKVLYHNDKREIDRIMDYITFKLECAAEQVEVRWKLDINQCKINLAALRVEELKKLEILERIMPPEIEYKKHDRPKVMYKKDLSLSVHGQKWMDILQEFELPEDHQETVLIEVGRKLGNPGSHQQIKAWLFQLGWVPDVFKPVDVYLKEKGKLVLEYGKKVKIGKRQVPQVSKINEPGLTDSVIALFEANPGLEHLEGLYMVQHRIGILEGLLETVDEEGYVVAEIAGFTNTMRFRHRKPLVNLPTVNKPYGKEVRGVLTCPEGYVLCGSDVSSLEDQCKRHYMWKYDPDFVIEQMEEGFDPHLKIALEGGLITEEDFHFYKWYTKVKDEAGARGEEYPFTPEEKTRAKIISKPRKDGKQGNFSCTYGAFPPKIAEASGMPLTKAQLIFDTFWKINWSVKKVTEDALLTLRTVNGQMWIQQPVSRFWYSLRVKKDAFSTLNQSTGVFCFDTWVHKVRTKGIKLCGQFHDELAFPLKSGTEEVHRIKLQEAIKEANDELQLNIKLGVSVDFGANYADVH